MIDFENNGHYVTALKTWLEMDKTRASCSCQIKAFWLVPPHRLLD